MSHGGHVGMAGLHTLQIAGHTHNSPVSKGHAPASSTQESYGPKPERWVKEAALIPVYTAGQEAGGRALDEIWPAASSSSKLEPSSLKGASGNLLSICNVDSKIKNLMHFQAF